MRRLTCAAVVRELHAFHDGELPVAAQIAVAAHLDGCDACAAALADLRGLTTALRAYAPGRTPLPGDEAAGLTSAIVSRARAEHDVSLVARLQDLLDDKLRLYAGLGAAAATLTCLAIMLGMMRFATIERPDSLAGILNPVSIAGSNQNPVVIDARMMMPRALDTSFSNGEADQDSVFALSAVVTREGRLANLELLDAGEGESAAGEAQAKRAEGLLDAVSRARFEPATRQGLPVAVNMVWLVAHTTVRATTPPDFSETAGSSSKKRITSMRRAGSALRRA